MINQNLTVIPGGNMVESDIALGFKTIDMKGEFT